MKTSPFFRTLLIVLLIVAAGNGAMAQSDSCVTNVIHTYMNGRPIQWDSVKVKVQDAPYHTHSFMLYWPDTILANCPTGVNEYASDKGAELSQVFPNPCVGTSQVKLTLQNSGTVCMRVMDMQGRICCQKNFDLPTGEHLLSLTLPQSGLFFVQAETGHGSETCKVLCTEGAGSDFDIRLTSTSFQSMEKAVKAGKGGEGQFNRMDQLVIIAYITYNGGVRSSHKVVNCTEEVDGYTFDDWMYNYGSVNIFFRQEDTTNNIILSGKTFRVIVGSQTCLPFIEYPVGYRVTFSDSTFYSEPETFASYSSSTWLYNGTYKYRYYPNWGGDLCICSMDETLPPMDIPSSHCTATAHCNIRPLRTLLGESAVLSKFSPVWGNYDEEWMIIDDLQANLHVCDVVFSGCLGNNTRNDTVVFQYENGQLSVRHNLRLNCAASNVIIYPTINNNIIDITYLVDDNISANCICPTELSYSINNFPSGTYIVIIRVGNTVIYQQNHSF